MKNTKRNKINIIFSSFLVIGYIVCAYFFSLLASQVAGLPGTLIQALILVVFGLLLFYATRVGEGRQVRRFSLAVLLLVDIPALFIILAGLIEGMPFHDAIAPASLLTGGIAAPSVILALACVALGYGIPYTFFSGYELKEEDEETPAETDEETKPLEGGLAEELAAVEAEAEAKEAEAEDAAVEEIAAPEADAEEAAAGELAEPAAEAGDAEKAEKTNATKETEEV